MIRDSGPPLTGAQQRLLRDPEALLMVERLADRRARRYGLLLGRDDLVALGRLGLVHAARTYRSDSGVSFADFAWSHAGGRMMDAIAQETVHQKALREGVERCVENERDEAIPLHDTEEDQQRASHDLIDRVVASGMLGVVGGASRVFAEGGESDIAARDTLARACDALNEAMAALPEAAREIVRLHHYEGHTLERIAGAVGLPNLAAARREHKRILRRLAVLLRARGVSEAPEPWDDGT